MVYAAMDGWVWGIFGIIGGIIFGVITALIARSKGHSPAWGIVGFLLPIVGLIIVLLLKRRPYAKA